MSSLILIHPPVVKACEPPAGIALLAGALRVHGIPFRVLDANIEGLLHLLGSEPGARDTWTRGARKRLDSSLEALRSPRGYTNFDRYVRAVGDLERLLKMTTEPFSAKAGLGDYHESGRSPLDTASHLDAAEHPETNPFFCYFSSRIERMFEEDEPAYVGISMNFLSQALTSFAIIGFMKRLSPATRIILGGGLVTSWSSRPGWNNPWEGLVDEIVSGPGEGPLLRLLGAEGIEDHYTPDYTDLPLADYFAPVPVTPYSASTGCYWSRCTFCPERAEGNAYTPVKPAVVGEDLEKLGEGPVHFLDNAISPALLKYLCERPPGRQWFGFARITRHLADPDFCRALREAGCIMLQLGVESGDQGVLDALGKGLEVELTSRVLANLRQAGIATYIYLLFGTPAEDEISAARTFDFTIEHAQEIGFLNLAIFNLPIYGPDAKRLDTGEFYDGDLSLYSSFEHPSGWSRKRVRQFLDSRFKKHPAIRPIIKKDPPVFTSNHAPFFR